MSAVLVGELLSVAMFVATVLAILAGYPVAFTLAGVGLLFAALGIACGVFDVAILSALVGRYFGTMTNETRAHIRGPYAKSAGVRQRIEVLAEEAQTPR